MTGPMRQIVIVLALLGCAESASSAPPRVVAPVPAAGPACATLPAFAAGGKHPDQWVADARKYPATAGGPLGTDPMTGPAPRINCNNSRPLPPIGPFTSIQTCSSGDHSRGPGPDNIAIQTLVLGTPRGAFTLELGRDVFARQTLHEGVLVDIVEVSTRDLVGDAGAEVLVRVKRGPPGGNKDDLLIVCGMGPSATPSCARLSLAEGGPFHGKGSQRLDLTIACDGSVHRAGWIGGSPVSLVHQRDSLAFP
jgi:hypothetical protein